jgi:hypothetical protein
MSNIVTVVLLMPLLTFESSVIILICRLVYRLSHNQIRENVTTHVLPTPVHTEHEDSWLSKALRTGVTLLSMLFLGNKTGDRYYTIMIDKGSE